MGAFSVSGVSRSGNFIRWTGGLIWSLVSTAGLIFLNGELIGAAGAVGICFLLPYVFLEQKSINEQKSSMQRFFGDVKIYSETMTSQQYDDLDEEEKNRFGEAESDYLSAKMGYESDLSRVKHWEIAIAIFLTLQWAFSNLITQLFVDGAHATLNLS